MTNPKRKHSRRRNPSAKRVVRRHRRNPAIVTKRRRGGARRRNPFSVNSIAGYKPMELLKLGAGAAAGAIATRASVQLLLKDKNAGAMGYGANLLASGVLGFVASKFDGDFGKGVMTGGIAATILRIWTERVSQTSASALSGLGDIDFSDDGLGTYLPALNPTPQERGGSYQVTPAAIAAAPGTANVPKRLASRFA